MYGTLPLHNLAILANQELREIPFDIVGQDATLLALQKPIQGISCKLNSHSETLQSSQPVTMLACSADLWHH